jgi:hypothetical protein
MGCGRHGEMVFVTSGKIMRQGVLQQTYYKIPIEVTSAEFMRMGRGSPTHQFL